MVTDYKPNNIMKLGFPKEHVDKVKKNKKENRLCDICDKPIIVGEVYFSNETVLSYWVHHLNSFHIDCLLNNVEAKECCLQEDTYDKNVKNLR
jgi:hypothetical protein